MTEPLVTVVIPSLNQAKFLPAAIESALTQSVATEIFVMDGGSTDGSLAIIEGYEDDLAGWVSAPDGGQAAAINGGIALGTAPFVCWLNSDDILLEDGLLNLHARLTKVNTAPAVYGQGLHINASGKRVGKYLTFGFSERLLASYCFICQPATLIRRSCWDEIGGLDENLELAMDYDLWWRLYRAFGPLTLTDKTCAANRKHLGTKTQNNLDQHYDESIFVVKKYYGSVPWKWHLMRPMMRGLRALGL